MEFEFTDQDKAFRAEVQAFLRDAVPADIARRTRSLVHTPKDDLVRWNRILFEKGWVAPHWPKAFGGTGWTPMQIYIFEEECAAADAPFLSYFGLRLIGPLLYTFGSEAHRAQHIPGILSGDVFWCQGFSEPSSGSDLASLKTRAVRDGDHWVITGQKLWTTEAHFADKMFCLARTDPDLRPQKGGLSILFLDMNQPGVTVRPIVTIDGGHSVNEVFLDEVRVPAGDVLGRVGQGWDQAKFLLGHERVTNAQVPRSKRELALLRTIALKETRGGMALAEMRTIRERIAEIEIDLAALEWSVLRELFATPGGAKSQGTASALKIVGSEIQQRIADLTADLLGAKAMPTIAAASDRPNERPGDAADHAVGVVERQLFFRATTIYAGTNEIQREIIARELFAGH